MQCVCMCVAHKSAEGLIQQARDGIHDLTVGLRKVLDLGQ